MIFDLDQAGSDLHQRHLVGALASGHHRLETRVGLLHPAAQLAQSEDAERVADLAQQGDLRGEFLDLSAAAAHEHVEHILDARQVLADRSSDRMHELDRWRGEIFSLLFDAVIDRQQLIETERGTHRRLARAGGRGARHVIQQVVQQLDGRDLRIARLALFVEPANLTVGQAQQPLNRYAALHAVLAQSLEHGTDHPPELEHALLRGHLLKARRHGRQYFEVLLQSFTAYPPDQAGLEARPQAPRPLRGREWRLARRGRGGLRLTVGLEIEQQQRAFGQQRAAAHRTQIVQQRQQHQCQITAAGQHALEVAGQLHHGAHQCIERLGLILALFPGANQIARHLLHFFGQQRRAVNFQHPQCALHLVQFKTAAFQQRGVLGLLDVRFQRGARLGQRRADFARDLLHGLCGEFRHGCGNGSRPHRVS